MRHSRGPLRASADGALRAAIAWDFPRDSRVLEARNRRRPKRSAWQGGRSCPQIDVAALTRQRHLGGRSVGPILLRRRILRSSVKTKNIPLERIIEDPVFKQSHQSYMIQLADCVAFSLLKREVPPTPLVRSRRGLLPRSPRRGSC